MRCGPPFNGYLIHKLVLEKKYLALNHLLSLSESIRDEGGSCLSRLDVNRKALVDKNTALHLAVASADLKTVKVNHCIQLTLPRRSRLVVYFPHFILV